MLKNRLLDCGYEVGCDEVGRGCLAGPVVAAAVLFPKDFYSELIKDSKKLNKKQRNDAECIIKENAISYAIAEVSVEEIDKINILNASILAMQKAIDKLSVVPEHILVDGNRFKKYKEIPYTCVIKGDSLYLSIAAASILAKNYRDKLMDELHEIYPNYNWKQNRGYPTKEHREAIQRVGFCEFHRKSFKLFDNQLQINF